MIFSEKLQLLRKSKGLTQENLAEKMDVSRQAVARWEAGQAYPDIGNLIAISRLFHVTVDYLVKDQACAVSCTNGASRDIEKLVTFRLEANVHTYAAYMNAVDSPRFFLSEWGLHLPRYLCRRRAICRRRSNLVSGKIPICHELYGAGSGAAVQR